MADISITTTQPASNIGGVLAPIKSFLGFLFKNWYWFALVLFFTIGIVVIFYLIMKLMDTNRERDEPGFAKYKMTVKDCLNNANAKYHRKRYSFKNLFWLGIPILWVDLSKRIIDKFDNTIGRYRGHIHSQDGTINYLICKKRILGIIDYNILVKVPTKIDYDKNTDKSKKSVPKIKRLHLVNDLQGYIRMDCIGVEKVGLFYHMPIIQVMDELTKDTIVLDVRKMTEGAIIDNTYQVMLQRALNSGAKQIEKAIELNPRLKYDQKSPEKTSAESKDEAE